MGTCDGRCYDRTGAVSVPWSPVLAPTIPQYVGEMVPVSRPRPAAGDKRVSHIVHHGWYTGLKSICGNSLIPGVLFPILLDLDQTKYFDALPDDPSLKSK